MVLVVLDPDIIYTRAKAMDGLFDLIINEIPAS